MIGRKTSFVKTLKIVLARQIIDENEQDDPVSRDADLGTSGDVRRQISIELAINGLRNTNLK